MKTQNPNITIIVEEVGPKLKERFLEMIELVLLENRALNQQSNLVAEREKSSPVDWQYGPHTEYFLKNDILGTIVSFASGNDMPRDLVDEVAYMIASFAHDLPAGFLCNEAVLRPVSQFLDILMARPSKYSVVLCEKIVQRIEDYPPLWNLFTSDNSLASLMLFLAPLPEAFRHMINLHGRLFAITELEIEAGILPSLLDVIVERLGTGFDVIMKAFWTEESIATFMESLLAIDSFVLGLKDEGKFLVATKIKESFIPTYLRPALRQLKLYDGSVVISLGFLSSLFLRVESVELCLLIGQCFKNYFFTESVDDTDCLNLTRLMFTEGETALSLAIVELLRSLLENKSRRLLAIFQGFQATLESPRDFSLSEHQSICSTVMGLIERLPEAIIDKNIENMSLLYRSHLIFAERCVPPDETSLNAVDQEASIFSSLLIKTLDSFSQQYWGRQPLENLEICRFLLSLLTKSDISFVCDKLLGTDEIFSLVQVGQRLVGMTEASPIKEHMAMAETTRSIARFRANLFSAVHDGSVEKQDMFNADGLLSKLLAGNEAKTVGALSGNVLLFSSFYMRLLAIIQTQSTRPFKTIHHCS